MVGKKSRFHRIKRLGSVLLLLSMFLGAGLLPPAFAYMTAENSIVQSLPDTQSLLEQGRKFYVAERFAEAAAIWQQAVTAFKAIGDELRQAMTLCNLSLAYQQLGQWSEAEQAIAQSLNLLGYSEQGKLPSRRKIPIQNSEILAQALDIQGRLQLALATPEDALSTWRQAANIYAQIGNNNAIIRNHINSAQALQALGLYRQAQKTLTESTQLLQNQPDSLLKVTGLRSLGNVLRVTGDLAASRQILQQSLAVATLSAPQLLADVLLSLGNTARTQQDTQAAIEFYRQADLAATSPITRIYAQTNQLRLLLETKQISAAQTLSSQIQTQIGDLPPSRTAIYAQINFAESLTQLRQNTVTETNSWLDIAQRLSTAAQQAKNLQDQRTESYALGVLGGLYEQTQQWSNAQNLTQQALFMAQAIDAKDITYRWQWQLGRLLKARGDMKGAIAAYDQAVKTLQSLRYDLVAVNPEAQFSFREEVEPVYRQLVELLLQRQGNSPPSKTNLRQARDTIEALQLAELDNFFREACLAPDRNIDQVVDQKDQTAAVIYPIILADGIEIILKLPQQELRHYATRVPQSKVESTLQQLRQNLEEPYTSPAGKLLSQQVYDWLLRPAEADLAKNKVKTLVFVLDGSLRNIPLAALYDGRQYLVQKYAVALTPSLQLLDPKPLERRQLRVLSAGLSEARHGFSRLNYVESELQQIKSEVPGMVLLNQSFTSTALQKQISSLPFPVVHLATHGQFSSNADQTFILAWDKPIKVKEFSHLLQVRDQSSSQAIELLVLSACETAAGDKRAVLGLAGVSVRSGARSTLASLWNLDDESGSLLLSQFYRELAQTPLNKAEALRRAQLTLLQNPDYRHPSHWAPFVLVGNWL